MYERVLRFFELSKREQREIPQEYWICRETAYNLSLIYKQRCVLTLMCLLGWVDFDDELVVNVMACCLISSGANDLARYLIAKYLTLD